jgi:hypothetical protein
MDPYPGGTYDPISLHKYLYANADPINFTDPSGLSSLSEYRAVLYLAGRLVVKRIAAAAASARLAALRSSIEADRALSSRIACYIYIFIKGLLIGLGPDGSDSAADAFIERFCS